MYCQPEHHKWLRFNDKLRECAICGKLAKGYPSRAKKEPESAKEPPKESENLDRLKHLPGSISVADASSKYGVSLGLLSYYRRMDYIKGAGYGRLDESTLASFLDEVGKEGSSRGAVRYERGFSISYQGIKNRHRIA